jgi:glutamate-1-semialdehyde 2,1-aminomutase
VSMSARQTVIDRARLRDLVGRERRRFAETHPRSLALYRESNNVLLNGVPMCWMSEWAGGFPIFLAEATGNRIVDADGLEYLDFCLGDSAAMAGHGAPPIVHAVERQFRRGATAMLPTEDAVWVGRELARRFGLEVWQFSLTATDANRWAVRIARYLTGRRKVLVFNGCYHGTVDEAVIELDEHGTPRARRGNLGPAIDPTVTTKIVEFNDLDALAAALKPGDVAAVLTEPALTNIGIVLPDPGFHEGLRRLTRQTGTLLILDETHTISSGPAGYTGAHGLQPDMLTIGKPIAGGIPIGAYGMRRWVADQLTGGDVRLDDTGAFGGTLAGNALSMAAARATLEQVLTEETFTRTISLAKRLQSGVENVIASVGLPWSTSRVGARAECRFCPTPPRTGGQSAAAADEEVDACLHSFLLNHGVLITPFHNMALISPTTTESDVDQHTHAFATAVDDLLRSDS